MNLDTSVPLFVNSHQKNQNVTTQANLKNSPLLQLPPALIREVLKNLEIRNILTTNQTCHTLRACTNGMGKYINFKNIFYGIFKEPYLKNPSEVLFIKTNTDAYIHQHILPKQTHTTELTQFQKEVDVLVAESITKQKVSVLEDVLESLHNRKTALIAIQNNSLALQHIQNNDPAIVLVDIQHNGNVPELL